MLVGNPAVQSLFSELYCYFALLTIQDFLSAFSQSSDLSQSRVAPDVKRNLKRIEFRLYAMIWIERNMKNERKRYARIL